jgi:adenylate cyclase
MRLRFRTAQILALVTVLLITVAVVGISSYRNSTFALRELSTQVLEQTSQRIDQKINSTLAVAVSQSTTYENLISNGTIDPNDHVGMSTHFLGSIRANPALSYLSFGTELGEYWHVQRTPENEIIVQYVIDEGDGKVLINYRPEKDGSLTEIERDPKTTRDPRVRPYYVAGKKAGKQTWTETYIFMSSSGQLDIPGVTRATPIYEDGRFTGVLTADFDLAALSSFLRELPVGKNGFAFILELRADGERRVIGHPNNEMLTRPAEGGGRDGMDVSEFGDPRVRALAAELPQQLRQAPTETLSPLMLTVDGTDYLGGYRRLSGHDLDWIICMMMPEDDVMGSVYANTRTTVIIVVIGIVVAILVALVLSAAIASTLRELARESESIGKFELESKEPRRSYLVEVRQLAVALEEMKTGLRSFQKFVPADLVRNLLASGEEAKLGGHRREISIFFSDIAGFTPIAESMDPDDLVELLGEFLGKMTEKILEAEGTVDKYIGDAIMAFWGAPNDNDDHALAACKTAIACQRRLAELNVGWQKRGWKEIRMRVGLHTGEAIVGNFGSESRLDYTAIGDAVNLASRLEGLNKYYGTSILMSDSIYQRVEDKVVVRPLDRVSVKGRAGGLMVYELIGIRGDVADDEVARSAAYGAALEAYLARDWDAAESKLADLVDADPGDVAAHLLLERVRGLAASPPDDDWDGVHRMSSK